MVRCAASKFALCQLAQPKLATRALLACFRASASVAPPGWRAPLRSGAGSPCTVTPTPDRRRPTLLVSRQPVPASAQRRDPARGYLRERGWRRWSRTQWRRRGSRRALRRIGGQRVSAPMWSHRCDSPYAAGASCQMVNHKGLVPCHLQALCIAPSAGRSRILSGARRSATVWRPRCPGSRHAPPASRRRRSRPATPRPCDRRRERVGTKRHRDASDSLVGGVHSRQPGASGTATAHRSTILCRVGGREGRSLDVRVQKGCCARPAADWLSSSRSWTARRVSRARR